MRLKLKDFIRSALAIAAATLLAAVDAFADGIVYNGTEYSNGANLSIEADASKTYTFTAKLPAVSFASLQWSTLGGIEIVSGGTSPTVTIRCKSGTTYDDSYSLYAKGRLILSAEKETTAIAEGCEDCLSGIVCNPYYSYSLNIYKTFDWSGNAIVGDKCAQPGDSVTFSVAPWVSMYQPNDVGFDTYEWDIPSSLNASKLYYSADKSSVTFVVSDNIEGQVIKARMGKYNIDANTQQPLALTLSNGIPKPQIEGMADDDTYCLPFSTPTASLIVSNASPEASYVWKMRTWDILSLSANGDTVTFRPQENEQVIQLQVEGGCTPQSYLYQINRSLPADASIANSYDDPYCLPASKNVTLSVAGVPVGTSLEWQVDGDGWLIPDAEKNKATPAVTTGEGPAKVTVRSTYCPAPELTATLNIEPQKPANIDGPACLTFGQSQTLTYTVPAVDNAAQYEWSYPSTWTVSGADNQNTITLISDGQTADSVKVRAVGCNESEWSSLAVKMGYPAPKGINIKSECLNPGLPTTIELEVEPPEGVASGVSYEWAIPSSFASMYSYYTDKSDIRIRTTGNLGVYPISVTVNGSCGTNSYYTDTISMTPSFYISTYVARKMRFFMVDEDLENADYYQWYINGKLLDSGKDLSIASFTLSDEEFGAYFDEGVVCVIVTEGDCKTKVTYKYPEADEQKEQQQDEEIGENKSLNIANEQNSMTVSPNPATGNVKVSFLSPAKRRLSIFNQNGESVLFSSVTEAVNTFSLAGVTPGLYYVVAIDSESKYFSKLLVK